jgi:hypothetical protein
MKPFISIEDWTEPARGRQTFLCGRSQKGDITGPCPNTSSVPIPPIANNKRYLEKIRMEEASIDWAHRVLINGIRQQRMLKMMAFADNRHFGIKTKMTW